MAESSIKVIPNGPYRVTGPTKVTDPQGNVIDVADGRAISLCRCGASENKPYCDGTHGKISFQASDPVAK